MEMEMKIANVSVDGNEYFVIHPFCPPVLRPTWLALDADGKPVCDYWNIEYITNLSEEFREALEDAAYAAAKDGDGEPLEDRLAVLSPSAIERAEEIGWVVRYGPAPEEVIWPFTPVYFWGDVPSSLLLQARGDVWRALQLLAICVRKWDADPVSVFAEPPEEGIVVTAAELAAS